MWPLCSRPPLQSPHVVSKPWKDRPSDLIWAFTHKRCNFSIQHNVTQPCSCTHDQFISYSFCYTGIILPTKITAIPKIHLSGWSSTAEPFSFTHFPHKQKVACSLNSLYQVRPVAETQEQRNFSKWSACGRESLRGKVGAVGRHHSL